MRKKLLAAAVVGLIAAFAQADPNAALTRLADGFDFPVGKPNADGYRISRGFTSHGHLGEDWVGQGGSGTDFRDPVYAVGNGIVTLARDFRRAWGNVVVVRHAFMEEGQVKYADSLYAHLDRIVVREGQQVARGQQIGTIGNAHGLYPPHLHFEVHKNVAIGVVHTAFTRDFNNYQDPTTFVSTHRNLKMSRDVVSVAMNTYVMPTFQGVPAKPAFHNTLVAKLSNSDAKKRWNLFSLGN